MLSESVYSDNEARGSAVRKAAGDVTRPRAWLGPSMSTDAPDGSESSDSTECPTCGRDDFASNEGMRRHHAMMHDEQIRTTVTCAWCGDTRETYPSRADRSERHFCDKDCRGAWVSENMSGKDASRWDGGEVKVRCAWCGEPKEVRAGHAEECERHFCDQDCQGEWRSENVHGETHPLRKDRLVVECDQCGQQKEVLPYKVNDSGLYFCDLGCMGTWRSENQVGEDNPCWEGGALSYGTGWTRKKRRSVRERDGHQCQSCGISQEKLLSEDGHKLHVHHVIPARRFDSGERRNAEDNLVSLCRTCHRKWEGIPLRPSIVQ